MVLLTFLPGNVSISVRSGTTLLQAMIAAGLSPDAPCGGKGTCGKCRVLVGGEIVLACKTIADRDMTVTIPEGEDLKILTAGVSGNLRADGSHPYAAAFDIGTTTVVGFLLDGRTGELLATASAVNPGPLRRGRHRPDRDRPWLRRTGPAKSHPADPSGAAFGNDRQGRDLPC